MKRVLLYVLGALVLLIGFQLALGSTSPAASIAGFVVFFGTIVAVIVLRRRSRPATR
jgi:uncharacterized membrane protein